MDEVMEVFRALEMELGLYALFDIRESKKKRKGKLKIKITLVFWL